MSWEKLLLLLKTLTVMHTPYDELIKKYVAAKSKGKSHSEIRRELKQNRIEAVEIDYIISVIDDRIYEKLHLDAKRKSSINYIFIGVFLLSVTCGLYFYDLFKLNSDFSILINYGSSLSGVILILKGINEMMSNKKTASKYNKSTYLKK